MKNKFWMICLSSASLINIASAADINLASTESSFTQPTHDRVRLFDSFFTDAVRLDSPYAEVDTDLQGFAGGKVTTFKLRGGLPITSNIDVGMSFGGIDVDPDYYGDSETDVTDLGLVVRYHFTDFKPANLSAGIRFDLPTGDKHVWGDTLEFEAFGTIRIPFNEKLVTTAHLGFGYIEEHEVNYHSGPLSGNFYTTYDNEGEFSFFASTGAIYEIDPKLHLTAEFSGDTGNDAGFFTTGVDYEVIPNGRLRFGVGAGFGEKAPEYTVQGGFLFNFDGIGKIF